MKIGRIRNNPVLPRALPFILFIGFLLADSLLSRPMEAFGINSSWLVLGRGVIVAVVLAWFWKAYVELTEPAAVQTVHWVSAVVVGFAVFLIWIGWGQFGGNSVSPGKFVPLHANGYLNWPQALLRLAGLALVVPVMEELFWRSLILRWIDRPDFLSMPPRQVSRWAFVATTALFAVEHDMWFAGALAGIAYNALYMWSGNLWVPITSHAVTNGALGAWVIATRNWNYW